MDDFYKEYKKDVERIAQSILDDILSRASSLHYEEDVFLDNVIEEVRKSYNELSENN